MQQNPRSSSHEAQHGMARSAVTLIPSACHPWAGVNPRPPVLHQRDWRPNPPASKLRPGPPIPRRTRPCCLHSNPVAGRRGSEDGVEEDAERGVNGVEDGAARAVDDVEDDAARGVDGQPEQSYGQPEQSYGNGMRSAAAGPSREGAFEGDAVRWENGLREDAGRRVNGPELQADSTAPLSIREKVWAQDRPRPDVVGLKVCSLSTAEMEETEGEGGVWVGERVRARESGGTEGGREGAN